MSSEINERSEPARIMRSELLQIRKLPDGAQSVIAAAFPGMVLRPDVGTCRTTLLQILAETSADVILASLVSRFDHSVISALPNCVRVLASYSAGLDHIDVEAAKSRNIQVVGVHAGYDDSVAEVAMRLLISIAIQACCAEQTLRSGSWSGWSPDQIFGRDLCNLRLGIVGCGRIGRAISRDEHVRRNNLALRW